MDFAQYSSGPFSFLLLLQGGHLLGLAQGVDGDGKEDVEEGVVPKQGEEDEVSAVDL